jgi:hypothetical protein
MSPVKGERLRRARLTLICGGIAAIAGCSGVADPSTARRDVRSEATAAVLSAQLLVPTDTGVMAYPWTRRHVSFSSSGVRQDPIESSSGATLPPGSAPASLLPRQQLHLSQSRSGQVRAHHLNSRLVWKRRSNGNDYALNLADDADDHSGEPSHYFVILTNGKATRFIKVQYSRFHGRWAVVSGAAYDMDGSGHWTQGLLFTVSDLSVASARRSPLRTAMDALAVVGSALLPARLAAQTTGVYSPLGCILDTIEISMAAGSLIDAAAAALAYDHSQISCGATTTGGEALPGTPTLGTVYVTVTCTPITMSTDYYIDGMYVGSDTYVITPCS